MMMMKMVMKMVCVMTSDDGNDSYCGMDGEITIVRLIVMEILWC